MKKNARKWRGFAYAATLLLALGISAGAVAEQFSTPIDQYLGTHSSKLVSDDSEGELWSTYKPSADLLKANGHTDSEKLIKKFIKFGRRQAAEGSVLLKNEAGTLPLKEGSKVSLLGLRSHRMLQGATMGMPIEGPVITLEDALDETVTRTDFANTHNVVKSRAKDPVADVSKLSNFDFKDVGGDNAKFKLNPVTKSAYHKAEGTATLIGPVNTFSDSKSYNPNEPSLDELVAAEANFIDSLNEYDDAAIVVVGRQSSENLDYGKGGVAKGIGANEPLQLTANEKAIIEEAKSHAKKVIVLVNTASQIEIGDLKKDPKIGAILWVGMPGNYGTLGIADILSGKVSPSGGLSDTYATSNLSAPAMMNMGNYDLTNASEIKRGTKWRDNFFGMSHYVIECESIYTGYKYYETRYEDTVYNRFDAKSSAGATQSTTEWKYADEVAYPFGYGLTYGKGFKQELVGQPKISHSGHDFTMDFDVRVTNLDDKISGKSNVQLYGQAPYKVGGLEKASVQLLAYDKTEVLKPGASQTLTIHVDLQNLASYDMNHDNGDGTKGTWVLDDGDYFFTIGNGAHNAINNILAKKGFGKNSGMDEEGDKSKVYEYKYDYSAGDVDDATFSITKNKTKVSNHLDYSQWNYYEPGKVTELSRSKWKETYPVEYKTMTANADMKKMFNGEYYTVKTNDDTSKIVWGSKNTNYVLSDLKGASYDDPRWEDLLNQMTMEEAMGLIACGGNEFRTIDSIKFPHGLYTENSGNGIHLALNGSAITDSAPWAIEANDNNANYQLEVFACAPVVASSFNPALQEELGEIVGLQGVLMGLPILWGPGLNTHRTAYNGRNGDYYSEDPILCGVTAMEFSHGALQYGLIASPKHFAFNDQETNRAGIAPFMTEQRARETELRAFQIAVESTKYDTETHNESMLGIMVSFSKIGPVECTCSRGLMTDILQNEWGFHGYAVTDITDDMQLFSCVINAGVGGYDVRGAFTESGFSKYESCVDKVVPSVELYAKDANIQNQLKRSAHNVLYAFSQSNLMNATNSTTREIFQMTWWRGLYMGIIIVSGLAVIGSLLMAIRAEISNKGKE